MSKLVIGSANFGMNYGFRNSSGKLQTDLITEILDYAWRNGVDTIDTAMGYGDSENVIGNYLIKNQDKDFKIITKINKSDSTEEYLARSLKNLKRSQVYGILIHDFKYYEKRRNLLDDLLHLRDNGICEKVGFSLYYPEDLDYLLHNNIEFNLIQIAYSIFDRRFEKYFPILKERNVEIHIRSVFLQGLYFMDPHSLGSHFDKVKKKIEVIQNISKRSGLDISSICLNFVSYNSIIDKIVVGLDKCKNLENNLKVLKEKNKIDPYMDELKELSENDVDILFPHFWQD